MFPASYFAARYFAPRYWPQTGAAEASLPDPTAVWSAVARSATWSAPERGTVWQPPQQT